MLKNTLKVAISTELDRVCPHFGRAPEFTFLEFENNKLIMKKSVPNPGHLVGNIPKMIHDEGADYMLTGGMGHRAQEFFAQYGIKIIMGVDGTIDEVINQILNGQIETMGGESICSPGGGKGFGVEKIREDDDEHHDHHH